MKKLKITPEIFEKVRAYDLQHHWNLMHRINHTRYYNYLVAHKNDVEVHTLALKYRCNLKDLCIKEVCTASARNKLMIITDLVLSTMSGYKTDWSKENLGRGYLSYESGTAVIPYRPGNSWKIACRTINPEALLACPKFRYCAWRDNYAIRIINYLKMYAANPQLEMLAKAGIIHLADKTTVIKKLSSDKGFRSFLARNAEEIHRENATATEVLNAYRRNLSVEESMQRETIRNKFRGRFLPSQIDVETAFVYAEKSKIEIYSYCNYLEMCNKLKLDFADTKISFPHDFGERVAVIREQYEHVLAREDRAKARDQDKAIAAVAAMFGEVEKIRSKMLSVRIPRANRQFVSEGKALKNCVGRGHYAKKMAARESVLCFVRLSEKPATPFVTVEYSIRGKRILQMYGVSNSPPPQIVKTFVEKRLLPALSKI